MTERVLTEALTEAAARPTALAQVAEQRAEAISVAAPRVMAATAFSEISTLPLPDTDLSTLFSEISSLPLPDTDLSTLWAETLAKPAPPLHAPALWVEVLRRDTAAAAMVTEAMDAFGESPWPDAPRGVFAFRHDWAEPLVERLQWATGVVRLASGNEVRQELRLVPRRLLTYRVGHARASDALVADWLADHLGRLAWWPLPQHAARLSSAAPRGALALAVTQADPVSFAPSALHFSFTYDYLGWQEGRRFALLMAHDGWQVLALSSVESDRLWLAEPLARAAPAGATVLPLVEGLAVEPAEFAQWVPGLMAGSVTAQVAFEPLPNAGLTEGHQLEGLPVWPDGNWRDDPGVTAQGAVTRQDLSPADPWVRRDDPWPTTTFQRRFLAAGRQDIARWRERLYYAQGRVYAFWLPDGLAPVLRVVAPASADDGFLRVEGDGLAAFWHRPAAALILRPDGQRQAVRTAAFHQDNGGVLVLRSGLGAPVPAGSRVLRLARCRLDHDAVDLYWHTPELVEIPLTLRRLPEPRGKDPVRVFW